MKNKFIILLLALLSTFLISCNKPSQKKEVQIKEISAILVGEKVTLEVNLVNLSDTIFFESSNTDVISVDQNGVVIGLSEGIANVTAYVINNEIKYFDTILVQVIKNEEPHQHISCSECGKCLADDCPLLEDKCKGHVPLIEEHECSLFKSDWISTNGELCGEDIDQHIICTKCKKVLDERTVDLDEDTMMEIALETGADDVLTEDDCYTVYTAPADFSAVRKFLEAKGINFIEADIEMVPNDYITLDEKQTETFLKMIDALEDSDDVQSIYHNVNLPEEEDED
mgnify:CR=1 FL=1